MKEDAITWGGLGFHEMEIEKSAEVIVVRGNELSKRGRGLTNW